jgi:hypothetical protein
MEYKYVIGDKTYTQAKLRLGQYMQLLDFLKDLSFSEDLNTLNFVTALGDKLPMALAVVLIEEGVLLKDKNLSELANELSMAMDSDQVMQVASDFFDCNQISSLLEKLGQTVNNIVTKMNKTPETT